MRADFKKLLTKAEEFSRENVDWHHHYLPPNCVLNSSGEHLIILEADGQRWESKFDKKPMAYLEKLENLFFKRTNL